MTSPAVLAYDAVADRYDGLRVTDLNKEENLHLMKYLIAGGYTGGDVAEGACGTGLLIDYLDEHIAPTHYVGVDISPEMLSIARAKHPLYAFSLNDMCRLPVLDRSVDAYVNIFGGLNYLTTTLGQDEALGEALRVLRPGGRLCFMVWSMAALALGTWEVYAKGVPVPRAPLTATHLQEWLGRAAENARIRGLSHVWLAKLPRWTPRLLYRALLWLEAKTWGKWWPERCLYLLCEATAPRTDK